jgi:tRNA A22 N-methylase
MTTNIPEVLIDHAIALRIAEKIVRSIRDILHDNSVKMTEEPLEHMEQNIYYVLKCEGYEVQPEDEVELASRNTARIQETAEKMTPEQRKKLATDLDLD